MSNEVGHGHEATSACQRQILASRLACFSGWLNHREEGKGPRDGPLTCRERAREGRKGTLRHPVLLDCVVQLLLGLWQLKVADDNLGPEPRKLLTVQNTTSIYCSQSGIAAEYPVRSRIWTDFAPVVEVEPQLL